MIVGFTMGMLFLKEFPVLSIPAIIIVLLSGMLAVLINSLLVTFIGLISFIIEDSNPIFWLYSKMILVLGVLFPIEYFPGILAQIMRYSPIYVTCYGPAKLFVDFNYSSATEILISQIIYLGIAWIMCYALYKKGVRRLNVTGG
jgi:ABC-2 type transport system permease protein